MHIEARVLEESLKEFVKNNILRTDDNQNFKYSPALNFVDSIEETARMYNERRTAVVNFIYAAPLRGFSDAFKFGCDD